MEGTYTGKLLFATLLPIFAFLLLAGAYFSDSVIEPQGISSDFGEAAPASEEAIQGIEASPPESHDASEAQEPSAVPPAQEGICPIASGISESIFTPIVSSSGTSQGPAAAKPVPAATAAPITIASPPADEALFCVVKAASTGAANSLGGCSMENKAEAASGGESDLLGTEAYAGSLEPSLYGSCYQCEPFGMCDADYNGEINMDDVQRMKEYAVGLPVECGSGEDDSYCDFDHSGFVTQRDILLFLRCLNFCSTMDAAPQADSPGAITCETIEPVICPNDCIYQRPCVQGIDLCNWGAVLPLGSPDVSNCDLQYNTLWEINTDATAICTFDGSQYANHILYISVDNDIINCTLNGELVMGTAEHEGCAPQDPRGDGGHQIALNPASGQNTLICNVRDEGVQSFFDACVVGDGEPYFPSCAPIETCQDCIGYGMCDANADGAIDQSDVTAIEEYLAQSIPTCGYNGYTCFCDVYRSP